MKRLPRRSKFELGFGVLVLAFIVVRLLCISIESFTHRESYQSCNAYCKNGDCDGYVGYAHWILGENIPWGETHTFRQAPGYNPYLTKMDLAVDPRGQFFVSVGGDDEIKFWQWNGQKFQDDIKANQKSVTSVAIHPKEKFFVTGGWDGTIHFYTFEGKLVKSVDSGQLSVTAVTFSPDGRWLATGGWDGTIRFWTSKGEPRGEQHWSHEGSISSLAFDPKSQILASASYDWSVKIWKAGGDLISTPVVDRYWPISGVAFAKDGSFWTAGESIYAHHCTSNKDFKNWTCSNHFSDVRLALVKILPSPVGDEVLTASNDPTAYIFKKDGSHIALDGGQVDVIWAIAYSSDGKKIVAGSQDGTLKIWSSTGKSLSPLIQAHYKFKPEVRAFGIPDHGRQIGMPLLISLYMRLIGAENSCAVKTVQPILLALFLICLFFLARRYFGSLLAIGLLIPFMDPGNLLTFFSTLDYTEFTLTVALGVLISLLYLGFFAPRNSWRYLGLAFLGAFVISQIKILIFVFLLQVVIAFSVTIFVAKFLKSKWIKKYDLRTLSLKLIVVFTVFILNIIVDGKLYPESLRSNERLTFMRYMPIPVKPSSDPLLEKYRRFQKVAFARTERYRTPGAVRTGFDSINYEFTLLNRDEHATTDPETKEVFYFNEKELQVIGYKSLLSNPGVFLKFGWEQVLATTDALLLRSGWTERSHFLLNLWVGLLLLGVYSLFSQYFWLAFSGALSFVFFYVYFTFLYIFDSRYWSLFSLYYYVTFAFGFAFAVEKILEWKSARDRRSLDRRKR